MNKMENVIAGVNKILSETDEYDGVLWDVLALLKEQEAIEPEVDSDGTCTCGNCGGNVGWYPSGSKEPVRLGKFCSECGRKVKWE